MRCETVWVGGAVPRAFIMDSGLRTGGARRDRTDDLKLAKLALSQLSYGPGQPDPPLVRQRNPAPARNWWAWKELNFRPHAYQARALTN